MAINSKRERIIVNVVNTIDALSSIITVQRKKLGLTALSSVAEAQLPMVAVVGGLPVPAPKMSGRVQGTVDKFISTLRIDVVVYALARENPDTTISTLVDDLWVALYADPTRGGLALSTSLRPEPSAAYLDPYIAFGIGIDVTYIHTTSSI